MIYLAAPLFNPLEREFNARLKNLIQYPVYLPQDDGLLVADLISSGVNPEEAVTSIFTADIRALNESNLLVAVLNGPHVDSGVAFEIGYFRALGKRIIGFHTDVRSELRIGFNPMIAAALDDIAGNEVQLLAAIEKWHPKSSTDH